MVVVLPVKRRLPIVSGCDAEARHSHVHHRLVIGARLLGRFPSNSVRVLRHFDASGNGRHETRLLMQFSLRSLRRRLAQFDTTSYHVPVGAVRWRSMDEKNFATVTPGHEHSDLGTCRHRRSVGNYCVRRQGTFQNAGAGERFGRSHQSGTIAGSNEREQGAANGGEHLFNLLSEAIRRPPG
jgi:hypothetical protein